MSSFLKKLQIIKKKKKNFPKIVKIFKFWLELFDKSIDRIKAVFENR